MWGGLLHASAKIHVRRCAQARCRGQLLSTDLVCPRCQALFLPLNGIGIATLWLAGLLSLVGATIFGVAWPVYLFLSLLSWGLWVLLTFRSMPLDRMIAYATLAIAALLSMGLAFSLTGLYARKPWPPADFAVDLLAALSFVIAGLVMTTLDVTHPRWPDVVYDALLSGGVIVGSLAIPLILLAGKGSKVASVLWVVVIWGFGLVVFRSVVEGVRRGMRRSIPRRHWAPQISSYFVGFARGLALESPLVFWGILLSAADVLVGYVLPMASFIVIAELLRSLSLAVVRFLRQPLLSDLGAILFLALGIYLTMTVGLIGLFRRLEVWTSLTLGLLRLTGPAMFWTALYALALALLLSIHGRSERGLFLGGALLLLTGWLMLLGIGYLQEVRMKFLQAHQSKGGKRG
ncbi:MAG: hypothetical protein QN189_08330 [Armatimonadota bacterium]|nr:hypothetical protein [Armatimonadota bacterium]MDR7435122.1 hypothetical protein [Armatimonadota bacterium]